jgi:flagellar basal-body rod protein FlgB
MGGVYRQMSIFDGIDTMQRGAGASWKRNSVILDNIANVDTPNFKASELHFERYFKSAMEAEGFAHRRTRDKHMRLGVSDEGLAGMVVPSATTERMDGNNVDIDKETTDFAKNVIFYNTLIQKINGQFTQLRTAIRGQSQ